MGASGRLLVLDDDDGIRGALRMAMEDEGYDVIDAASAGDALDDVRRSPVDVMLVDLMLGAVDGFTFIRQVRAFDDSPIVVISARADTHDVVAALEAGADDYMVKPFAVKELGARLRALRRRGRIQATGRGSSVVLRNGEDSLVLDAGAGRLMRAGQPVPLTVTEFRLLCELAAEPGRVLSRSVLLERVWDHGYFGDERIVDVHVRRMRTKIEQDPGAPTIVITVRGLGYRLDLP